MIELRVLGTLDLRDAESSRALTAVLVQPKRMALLAYLAAATPHGAHSRDSLLLLFWPNATEERARNSLNQAVFNLRRAVGEEAIVGVGDELRVEDTLVWCDAAGFEKALEAGDREQALSLYRGDLLPGFHLDDCIEFERWLASERERLRTRAVAAALKAAVAEQERRNEIGAVELLRRAVGWAPYDEPLVVRLVRLLAQLGDRPGAIREYERFEKLMKAELALSPSKEITQLVEEVRQSDVRESQLAGAHFRLAAPDARPAPSVASVAVPDFRFGEIAPVAAPQLSPPVAAPASATPARAARVLRPAKIAALAVALLVIMVGAVFTAGRAVRPVAASPPALDARRVLVAAFENRTGDAALDPLSYMAADWIAQGLAAAGFARAIPFSTIVQETPHLTAEGAAPEVAVPAANRQFAEQLGAGTVVTGAYYRSGDSLVFQAHVLHTQSGELLRGIDEVRGPAARPAAAIEELQRRTLGGLATLFDARLESWPDPGGQPASMEAYRLFSDGMEEFMRGMNRWDTPDRRRHFTLAAAKFAAAGTADTAFVVPLLWSAYAHLNGGNPDAAAAVARSLEQRTLSPWSAAVLRNLTAVLAHDFEGQYESARELAELSPDSEWLSKLARAAFLSGRWREARDVYLRMDTDRGWLKGWSGYWRLRTEVQHALGDHSAALADARSGLALQPSDRWLELQELWALAALGRADEILARIGPRLSEGDLQAFWQVGTVLEEAHRHGRTAVAARLLRLALPAAESLARRDTMMRARATIADLLYRAGAEDRAALLYEGLVRERPGSVHFRARAALLAVRRGDRRAATETLAWLNALSEEDLRRAFPAVEAGYWGSAEGWLALHQARLLAQIDDRDAAVDMLHRAVERGLNHVFLHLHDDPDLEPLRRRPGFQRLVTPRG